MDIRLRGSAETVLSNPMSHHNYFGWPSVARLQSGAIAVAASGYRCGHVCPFGKAVLALSFDDGAHFTGAFPVIDTPLDDRDAGIVPFGAHGVIFTSFNNTADMQKRRNPVSEELPPRMLLRNRYYHAYLDTVTKAEEEAYLGATFRLSPDEGATWSGLLHSPVTSPHGPAVLGDGTLLWVGRRFSADDSVRENDEVAAYTVAPDGTMALRGAVPAFREGNARVLMCEPHAVALPDGSVLCHIRIEGDGFFSLVQTRSADGGRTWSDPVRLLPERGGAPAHLLLHSSGTLISAYGYREAPFGVKVMLSRDLGKTWEKDFRLYTGVSADLGYPATVELNDGSLLTVFYARDEAHGPAVIKKQIWEIV